MYFRKRHICSNKLVSHSGTKAEIISLDAGLRLEGIPALILWDPVINEANEVLKSKILHNICRKFDVSSLHNSLSTMLSGGSS